MASPPQTWHVNQDPYQCRYAFFLSHVSDDKPAIRELKRGIERRLKKAGARLHRCFLDETDWRRAFPPLDVIQNGVFLSVHMVVWVTPKYLSASRRGWTWMEFAYAHQIEQSRLLRPAFFSPYIVSVFRRVKPQA